MSVEEKALATKTQQREYVTPEVDILEKGDEVVLLVNIPGADEAGTEVTLHKDLLTIKADVANVLPEGFEPFYLENDAAGYRRQFTLSRDVDRNSITASVKNGLLKITLKKAEEAKPKAIAISRD